MLPTLPPCRGCLGRCGCFGCRVCPLSFGRILERLFPAFLIRFSLRQRIRFTLVALGYYGREEPHTEVPIPRPKRGGFFPMSPPVLGLRAFCKEIKGP